MDGYLIMIVLSVSCVAAYELHQHPSCNVAN